MMYKDHPDVYSSLLKAHIQQNLLNDMLSYCVYGHVTIARLYAIGIVCYRHFTHVRQLFQSFT